MRKLIASTVYPEVRAHGCRIVLDADVVVVGAGVVVETAVDGVGDWVLVTTGLNGTAQGASNFRVKLKQQS